MLQDNGAARSKTVLKYNTWGPVVVMAIAALFGGVCAYANTSAVEFTCHHVDSAEALPAQVLRRDSPGYFATFAQLHAVERARARRRELYDRVSCSIVKHSVGCTWLFNKPSHELHFASSDWLDTIVTARACRYGLEYDMYVVVRDEDKLQGKRVLLHTFHERPRWGLARILCFLERVKRSQGDFDWKHKGAEQDARAPTSSLWSWVPFSSWFSSKEQQTPPAGPLANEVHSHSHANMHLHYAVQRTYFEEVVVCVGFVVFVVTAIFSATSETVIVDKNSHMFLLTERSASGLTTCYVGCSMLDIESFDERVVERRKKRGGTYVTVLEYGISVQVKPRARAHVKKSGFNLMCGETIENRRAVLRTLSVLNNLHDAALGYRGVGGGWGAIDDDGALIQPGPSVIDQDYVDLERMGAGGGHMNQRALGGDNSQTCRVCTSRKSSIVFLPCGHVCTCARCALSVVQGSADPQCPCCRTTVVSRARVYL